MIMFKCSLNTTLCLDLDVYINVFLDNSQHRVIELEALWQIVLAQVLWNLDFSSLINF